MPTVAQIQAAQPLTELQARRLLALARASAIYALNAAALTDLEAKLMGYAAATTLSGALAAGAVTATVGSTYLFPDSGELVIDSEVIAYTSKTATSFTGLTRGGRGTADVLHNSGASVRLYSLDQSKHLSAIVAAIDEGDDSTTKLKGGRDGLDDDPVRDREALLAEALGLIYGSLFSVDGLGGAFGTLSGTMDSYRCSPRYPSWL
jgi:hypothetical protein